MEFGAMSSFMPFLKAMVVKPSKLDTSKSNNSVKTSLSNSLFNNEISTIQPVQRYGYSQKATNNILGNCSLQKCSSCPNRNECKEKDNLPAFSDLLQKSIKNKSNVPLKSNSINAITTNRFNFSVGTIDIKSVGQTLNKVV
ncbi:MAG: hypothetical protein RSA79_07285 [Oscillospiraceae bacterium]